MFSTATTWGISSSTFLWGYAALAAAAGLFAAWRWREAMGPQQRADHAELDCARLALLNGGPQLAITTVAAKLHQDGVLRAGEKPRTLVPGGALSPTSSDLERAVVQAVTANPGITIAALRRELQRSDAVTTLTARLTEVGLLMEPGTIKRLRRLWLLGLVLAGFGAARIAAGLAEAAVGYLTVMALAVIGATIWLALRRPWATSKGRALVAQQRRERRTLAGHARGAELPMAVALFGGAALWAADPAIASILNVPRESAWFSVGGGSGGGGGSCGGGHGWGGDGGGGGGGGCGGGGS